VPADLPEHTREPEPPHTFGQLVVRREDDAVVIDRADRWVVATPDVLDVLQAGSGVPHVQVHGLDVHLTDSAGTTCTYRMRPDVPTPSGYGVALQRTDLRVGRLLREHRS
jgi:hypothetical protein